MARTSTSGAGALTLRAAFALGAILSSDACSTTQFNGFVSASKEDLAAVEKGAYNEAASAQIAITQNPDFNGGMISPKAIVKIQKYAISCQWQLDPQLAGGAQSAVNGAAPYSAAGAGEGPAAVAAFRGADAASYGIFGGVTYLFAGGVNGLVTGSYSGDSAKGTCTRDFWSDIEKTDPDFRGTHVQVVYGGKKWGNSAPPALQKPPLAPKPGS